MIVSVERCVALLLIVLGVSHIVQAAMWASFFTELRERRADAGLLIGCLTLPFGLAVLATHNIWVADFPILTTIVGWGWTFKGSLYLIYPRTLNHIAPRRLTPAKFIGGGIIALILGALIAFGTL